MPDPYKDLSLQSTGRVLVAEPNRADQPYAPDGGGSLPVRTVITLLDLLDEERVTHPDDLWALLLEGDVEQSMSLEITQRIQRVQAHLSRAGRRRDELAALFASSRELAEQREFGPLLRRLAQRAHDLVGADLAWLSEFHPTLAQLEVQAATGTISSQLEGVRVPAGQGMAWHVAAERRPHYSPCYHEDPVFTHDPGADTALAAEGVVSVLAVPLVAGDEVIGTLCVATRVEARFRPDQIALLTAFADHGAVILLGARLLAQARASAEEAEESRRKLAEHIEEMERVHSDHAELTECVLRGESSEEVAATLAKMMQREVTILDEDGAPLADSPGRFPVEGCWRHPDVAAAIAESRRTGRYVPSSAPGVAGIVAVLAGPTFLGSLLLARNSALLAPVRHKTIEDAARIMALLRLKQDALADAEERVRGELLNDMVEPGTRGTEGVRLRARSRGLNLDELTGIFLVSAGDNRAEVIRALRRMAPQPALVAEHAGAVVVAYPASAAVDAKRIYAHIRPALAAPILVVEAPRARGCDDVARTYREARRCLELLPALGVRNGAVATAPYRLYLRLFEPGAHDIDDFVTATIGPLLDRDEDRGTDLLHTVNTFADCNASTARTARAMHLHPNTVLQRLDRVQALLGAHWREPDEFFRIQVAVRIHRLRREATG